MDDELDVLADQPPEHAFGIAHHRIQVQREGTYDLLAAEGQQLTGEAGGVFPGFADLQNVFAEGIERTQAVRQQRGVSVDDHENVVEIVGHATGQPADAFQFLRLAELFPKVFLLHRGPPAFSGIVHRAQEADAYAARAEDGCDADIPALSPGRKGCGLLPPDDVLFRDSLAVFRQHQGERRLRDHLMYEFPDHLRGGKTGHSQECGVDVDEAVLFAGFDRQEKQRVSHALIDGGDLAVAVLNFLVCLAEGLLMGEVFDEVFVVQGGSIGGGNLPAGHGYPEEFAILALELTFQSADKVLLAGTAGRPGPQLTRHIGNRFDHFARGIVAKHPGKGRIGGKQAAVRSRPEDAYRRVIENATVLLLQNCQCIMPANRHRSRTRAYLPYVCMKNCTPYGGFVPYQT